MKKAKALAVQHTNGKEMYACVSIEGIYGIYYLYMYIFIYIYGIYITYHKWMQFYIILQNKYLMHVLC